VIGVDLGSGSVKVVRVEPLNGKLCITGLAVEELPPGVNEGPDWDRAVQEILRRVKAQGLLNGPIVLGFYHFTGLVESIRLPKMPASEMDQAVLWEAKERFSLSAERTVIRYLVTGVLTVVGQPQLEILVIGAPKQELMSQWHLLSDIGLKVVAVEPVSLAAFYGLAGLELWKPMEVVGLLEVGLRISHLSVVRGQAVRFARAFQVAGDSFTRSISDYCQLDYKEAEQLKRTVGISKMALEEDRQEAGHEQEARVRVSHALGLHMEQLVAEIEQSYRYFAFELGGTETQRMDRLVITGGGGLLRYLPEFLSSRLSVPASVADPLKAVEMAASVKELIQPGWSQRLAVSVGLALRSGG
jgi:type IV pilus assembly protein PilM